ncbi:hypothetical protein [Burkholderia multivorans]|nr:hypothetical protein [Burkholderia multivorans]MDN7755759.1 hypothetical protein [Burkholderia multivorans]MDN8102205.1 hypothetical protein [Burkholderia multivorans]
MLIMLLGFTSIDARFLIMARGVQPRIGRLFPVVRADEFGPNAIV